MALYLQQIHAPYTLDTPLLLCMLNQDKVGFLVENVDDVMKVIPSQIQKPRLLKVPRFVTGVVEIGTKAFWVMEIEKLFSDKEVSVVD